MPRVISTCSDFRVRQLSRMSTPARPPFAIGWEAARANAIPALILQAVMLALVLAFYFHPPSAALMNRIAGYRETYGLLFVVVVSICAGALLPELFVICCFQKGRPHRQNLRNLIFNTPFWAIDGVLVDLMYRTLAHWFGTQVTLPVVAAKICVDQFGYNPLFAAPYGIWGYAWKNHGYSWRKLRLLVTWQYYREHAIPVLIATWAVWIPLMAMIYSLPLALQFTLFALALTFWVLLMTYMTNRFAEKNRAEAITGTPVPLPKPAA